MISDYERQKLFTYFDMIGFIKMKWKIKHKKS